MEINVGALVEDGDSSVKADNAEGDDLISGLPEELLCSILSLLTARDATRVRVLSTRWRYLCASPSGLHLDLYTVFGIDPTYEYWYKHQANLWKDKFRFINAVNQLLHIYRSKKVNSFRLSYSLGNESSVHIDRWISFPTQIEKLELNFSFIPRGSQCYNFPCHLLFRDEGSKLKHLCLHYCVFRPLPDLKNHLSSLKTLDLNHAPLDQSDFDNLGSGCINLEWLRIHKCSLPQTLNIGGQYVCLKWLGFNLSNGARMIRLSYLKLTSFEYIGEVTYLSIFGIPSLEKVHLNFLHAFEIGSNYMFEGLAKDVPQLQILSLVLDPVQILPIPAKMTKFEHVKELVLQCQLSTIFDLLSVSSMLEACPCLEKFHLGLQSSSWDGEKVEMRYPNNKRYYQLKEVEISGFREESNSIDFAIHLLESAVVLERMIVNSQRRSYYGGGGEWHYFKFLMIEETERKLLQRLLSLFKDKINPDVQLIVK
ncbi:hypothetical protein LguiA_005600 [Lonicera macranthoides]